jgi:cell fate (sporulation/competence/biofilm development) regulator YlbF (YheA/YmcA/DUF963 family)
MDEVLAQAAALGRAIRGTEKFRLLKEAEAAVLARPDAVTLAGALAQLQQERAAAAKEGRTPDAAFRERYEKVEAAAATDPALVALARAQADFQALVGAVSRAMLDELKS